MLKAKVATAATSRCGRTARTDHAPDKPRRSLTWTPPPIEPMPRSSMPAIANVAPSATNSTSTDRVRNSTQNAIAAPIAQVNLPMPATAALAVDNARRSTTSAIAAWRAGCTMPSAAAKRNRIGITVYREKPSRNGVRHSNAARLNSRTGISRCLCNRSGRAAPTVPTAIAARAWAQKAIANTIGWRDPAYRVAIAAVRVSGSPRPETAALSIKRRNRGWRSSEERGILRSGTAICPGGVIGSRSKTVRKASTTAGSYHLPALAVMSWTPSSTVM